MPLYVTNRHACGPWWVRGPVQEALNPLRPIHLREFERRNSFGVVYALLFDTGLVKIGSTHDPKTRIRSQTRTLATYGGRKTHEVAVSLPCSNFIAIERMLHNRFAVVRHRGELFGVTIDQVAEALLEIEVSDEAIDISVFLDNGKLGWVFENLEKLSMMCWEYVVRDRKLRWGIASKECERVVALAQANTNNEIDKLLEFL